MTCNDRGHNENSRADHRAGNQHGRIEQAESSDEFLVGYRCFSYRRRRLSRLHLAKS